MKSNILVGKKVIFSSTELPVNIPKLSDKVRSRLSESLIANIENSYFKTRVKILKQKVKLDGYLSSLIRNNTVFSFRNH